MKYRMDVKDRFPCNENEDWDKHTQFQMFRNLDVGQISMIGHRLNSRRAFANEFKRQNYE